MNRVRKNKLSNSEEILMNVFWRENEPLTSSQIVKLCKETHWSSNYVHKLLGALQEKGYLKVCGIIQEGKHYSRQFVPCFDKEQYISDLLEDQGLSTVSFAKIAMALVKKTSGKQPDAQNEKLIEELEKMVEQLGTDHEGKKA